MAELIENEVADPRVGAVAVTAVTLSGDGRQLRVMIHPLKPSADDKQCLQGLESARGFLRRELAVRLRSRVTPDLVFAIDRGARHAERVETLLGRIRKRTPLAMAALAAALAAGGRGAEPERYETSAHAMGSVFTIAAYGHSRSQLSAGVETAFQEVRRIDQLLSNYRAASELSEVNRDAAQRPVRVSPELFELLEKCQQYSRLSEGAFDWTVGPLMKVWGFYRDSGRLAGPAEVAAALGRVGYQRILLDRERRTVSFSVPGMELDPGGIGKGYAVDRMADLLREAGLEAALISAAGSSIYALGAPPGEQRGWYVRIRGPKSEAATAGEVYLLNQSLSTSGAYEKFFQAEGRTYSHIMDPRTGYPAQGMASVAVVAPRTLDSEAWTKPFFVNGAAWTRTHLPDGFRVLLCEEGMECSWAP